MADPAGSPVRAAPAPRRGAAAAALGRSPTAGAGPEPREAAARRRPLLRKLAGYAATGGTAAIVDLGGFVLLVGAGLAILPAAALSFTVAAVVNFVLSARFVFGAAPSGRRFLLFFAFASLGLAFNTGVTWATAELAGFPPALAKLTGIGTAFLLNFAMNLLIVFPAAARRDGEPPPPV